LPLFTELPRRGVLGKWASGVFNSRNPKAPESIEESLDPVEAVVESP
jgi:hypothetical protein